MGCCCKNRPYLAAVLVLGLLGLTFHLIGFVAPGWIVMERTISITEISSVRAEATMLIQEREGQGQLIDNGGVKAPEMENTDNTVMDDDKPSHHPGPHDDKPGHHGSHPEPHHGPHHGPHHTDDDESTDDDKSTDMDGTVPKRGDFKTETAMFEEWTQEIMIKTDTMKVRVSYGLLFSRVCVGKPHGGKKDHDSSSEDDDDKRHGHHRHHCKKISTRCAMAYSYLFQDMTGKSRLVSPSHVAHASLKEHKAELGAALALIIIGVIAGVMAFKNREGPKCAAVICLLALIVGFVLISFPVARFSHFNRHRSRCDDGVEVHCPYSVVASGISAVFIMAAALVAGCGIRSKSQKKQPGHWYKFNNEVVEEEKIKEKQPSLVFVSEPLPEKAGLYDICNFDNLKPVETMKTPLE